MGGTNNDCLHKCACVSKQKLGGSVDILLPPPPNLLIRCSEIASTTIFGPQMPLVSHVAFMSRVTM